MLRQIRRNMLKNKLGTNRIQKSWRQIQIGRYGRFPWIYMYVECGGKKSEIRGMEGK